MPTMSENKKAGKADTFLSWTLGVLACLWVAWCCGIGPLYWFGTGLADFGWANVLYMAIAFVVSFAILWSLVRYGRGERVLPTYFSRRYVKLCQEVSGTPTTVLGIMLHHLSDAAHSRPGRAIHAVIVWIGRKLTRCTDCWWKLMLLFVIGWLWIPTTLLAQVDSSVGGKTGVDLPQGKNLVGAFYQPELVIIDTDILTSLPERIFNDGMAEVIKYGCIANPDILNMIAQPDFKSNMQHIVYECVRIKRDVVQQDEHDTGLRMILNFGHTIGHGAEKVGHFTELTHGQAVAIGMVQAAKLGAKLGETDYTQQITEICQAHELPTQLPYPIEDVYTAMLHDKKRAGDSINMILIHPMGKANIHKIPLEQLHTLLTAE